MLYPIENEIRQVKSLDGIWRFKKENRMEEGFEEKWYEKPLSKVLSICQFQQATMISQPIKSYSDHVGWVWYETDAVIPRSVDKGSANCNSFWQCYSACSCLFKR